MMEHTNECAYVERGEKCDCGLWDAAKHAKDSPGCEEAAIVDGECLNCGWRDAIEVDTSDGDEKHE